MGSPGTSAGDISDIISCYGGLAGQPGYSFSYLAEQFVGGSVFVSASIADLARQSSASKFFAPAQVGWATAPAIMTFDVAGAANGGWSQMSLNRQTLVVTIEYRDVDLTNGVLSWVQTSDKCVRPFN